MSVVRYVRLDVFTNQPFTGIQLAVFPAPSVKSGKTTQLTLDDSKDIQVATSLKTTRVAVGLPVNGASLLFQ